MSHNVKPVSSHNVKPVGSQGNVSTPINSVEQTSSAKSIPSKTTIKALPKGTVGIPDHIVQKFDSTPDGQLKWFSAPPMQVFHPIGPVHSLEYLKWKAESRNKVCQVGCNSYYRKTCLDQLSNLQKRLYSLLRNQNLLVLLMKMNMVKLTMHPSSFFRVSSIVIHDV